MVDQQIKMKHLHVLFVCAACFSLSLISAQYDSDGADLYGYGGDLYGYGYGYGYEDDGYGDNYDTYGYGGYDNLGYGGDGALQGSYYNEYGYYGDEDQAYYEYYGYYAEDQYGYEDYYMDTMESLEQCFLDANGKVTLSNGTAPCDIKISGVDKQAKKLSGGIDGVYKLVSCYNGKAMYKRNKSPTGEDRVLWYSSTFGDWDVSKGSEPNESEILMYGGEMEHASVPLFVSGWHLGADVKDVSDAMDDEFLPIKASVKCADGKVYKQEDSESAFNQVGPILTDDEMEMKYRVIYNRYGQNESSPTVSFAFVVLLVMTGLTIILAIPYFLLKKKGGKGNVSSSFAQILQDTRKKQRGHVN